MPSEHDRVEGKFYVAIITGDVDLMKSLCAENAWLYGRYNSAGIPWLYEAARSGNNGIVSAMLDLGFDPNVVRLPERSTPLVASLRNNNVDISRRLLEKGADPNLGRALLAAINMPLEDDRTKAIGMLLSYGADVNILYNVYGDNRKMFTALDYAKDDLQVMQLLVAAGAMRADEILLIDNGVKDFELPDNDNAININK